MTKSEEYLTHYILRLFQLTCKFRFQDLKPIYYPQFGMDIIPAFQNVPIELKIYF